MKLSVLRICTLSCVLATMAGVPASGFATTDDVETQTFLQDLKKAETTGKSKLPAPYGYVANDIPAVLSPDDVVLYKWLFDKQRRLQRAEVAAKVADLKDNLLMGNLIAERLLHPRTHASYAELKAWLENYNDQAPANNIYALALKRGSSAGLVRPMNSVLSLARYRDTDTPYKPAATVQDSARRRQLLNTLRTYRVEGQFEKALATLGRGSTRRLLGNETWYEVSLTLSRSLLNHGFFKEAAQLAAKVAEESPADAPDALWVAGFAEYRQHNRDEAVKHFRKLVYSVPRNSSHYARAAWWTARVYEEQQRTSMANVFLNMAAQDSLDFYGQLALEKLGKPLPYQWHQPEFRADDAKDLMQDPGVRRVIALAQIGEHALAQEELKAAYATIPYNMDETLLAFTLQMNLPNASLTLARNLMEQNNTFLEGLYPHSDEWTPYGGFELSRSLLNAIARQESAFNPAIVSRAGARGLMQLMPDTARFIRQSEGKVPYTEEALNNPRLSMKLGQKYLTMMEERLNGNVVYMIAAYNAGPGNVERWVAKDPSITKDPVLFIESIPFVETRKYVARVMANYWMYQRRFDKATPILTAMANSHWPSAVHLVASR